MRRNNVFIITFLLGLLSVILSPAIAPNFIASAIPGFYEGAPCSWLRTGGNRAAHQSILGRTRDPNALSVEVDADPLPANPSGMLVVRVTLINNTLGTLAIVYNPQQIITGDNGTSGIGLIFNPALNIPLGPGRAPVQTFPESDIRLLGPRQRCVHTQEIPAGNVLINPVFQAGQGQVSAYYRNNTPGLVVPQPGPTPIYPDQGLWTGFVSSSPEMIPVGG
ncbi:MAG: hypothetical protein ACUVS2_02255 [Candidatus Flexifilum sp.]|jgi:hypothetical protein